jgi:hypothetical protein
MIHCRVQIQSEHSVPLPVRIAIAKYTYIFIHLCCIKEAVSSVDGATLNGRMIDGGRDGVAGSAGGLMRYTAAAVALTG